PGQDDPRPQPGDPGAEEVPGHEQAGAGRGEAGRAVRHVLVHRAGERGAVPGHAAPGRVLRRAHGAGAQGRRRRRRPSVPGRRAGIALPQGGLLPRAGLNRRRRALRPWARRALAGTVALVLLALAATVMWPGLEPTPDPGPPDTTFDWQARVGLLAGDGHRGVRDGPMVRARFDEPWGLVRGQGGSLFIAVGGESN